ncbi:uncharacterized protein HMPREF1541_07938 [Cyphellophora europaea CBS 101466]|uniref:Uncharacterized protein n=1 Tax=Cyphellophora europaea (strain CBS 101466) TaxID=1220924 RepID=W2RKW3_CYPE1|nr:uncharacterized protein HMPREF1541_07938 [Cyphellophora europaea CBS 101466]ETN36950.1 hypothetical protein HMPREF1541_07938 [Cyphellophora europaea CBS 101466]
MAPKLMTIPAELRQNIFRHLFSDLKIRYRPRLDQPAVGLPTLSVSVRWSREDGLIHDPLEHWYMVGRAKDAAILFVSKQCHAESLHLLLTTAEVNIAEVIEDHDGSVYPVHFSNTVMPQLMYVRLDMSQLVRTSDIGKIVSLMPNLKSMQFELAEADYFFSALPDTLKFINNVAWPCDGSLQWIADNPERLQGIDDDNGTLNERQRAQSLLQAWNACGRSFDLVLSSTVGMIDDHNDVETETMCWIATTDFATKVMTLSQDQTRETISFVINKLQT